MDRPPHIPPIGSDSGSFAGGMLIYEKAASRSKDHEDLKYWERLKAKLG